MLSHHYISPKICQKFLFPLNSFHFSFSSRLPLAFSKYALAFCRRSEWGFFTWWRWRLFVHCWRINHPRISSCRASFRRALGSFSEHHVLQRNLFALGSAVSVRRVVARFRIIVVIFCAATAGFSAGSQTLRRSFSAAPTQLCCKSGDFIYLEHRSLLVSWSLTST